MKKIFYLSLIVLTLGCVVVENNSPDYTPPEEETSTESIDT